MKQINKKSLKLLRLKPIDHFNSMISKERNPQASHQSISNDGFIISLS